MKTSNLFWVGLTIFISVVIFVGGVLYLQDVSFNKSNYSFTVIFENVQGLNDGDSVNMLGKRIGKVSKTKIIGQQIAVVLSIDNTFAFKIPVDSKIEVKSEGLMGSKYISIAPGIETEKYILAGETVEGIRDYDFSEITPGIVPITQDLGVFARRLKATLGENEKDNIRQTIENIESLTDELDDFVKGYKGIVSERDRKNFKEFIMNLKISSELFKNIIEDDLHKIVNNVRNISNVSSDFESIVLNLKSSSKSFNKSIDKFDKILSAIENRDGSLGKIIYDPLLYDNLNEIAVDAKSLVNDIKENPTKYMKAYWKSK